MNPFYTSRAVTLISVVTASMALLAGCASSSPSTSSVDASQEESTDAPRESVASAVDLSDVQIVVGSKEYTEQLILGSIMVQALRAAGAEVEDQTGLTGTKVVRSALESEQVDAYYEYTGTAWLTILQNTEPVQDPQQLFEKVQTADAANGISWFALAPFNNTYAMVASPSSFERTGVSTISEYAALANEDADAATLCASAEFTTREDGLPGLENVYSFDLPASSLVSTEQAISLTALAKDDLCNFSYVTSTDPQIEVYDLTVLEDDKAFFPVYNPAVNMRSDLYEEHQNAYDELFGAISSELTQETILRLNSQVEIDGVPVDKVAEGFLTDSGII